MKSFCHTLRHTESVTKVHLANLGPCYTRFASLLNVQSRAETPERTAERDGIHSRCLAVVNRKHYDPIGKCNRGGATSERVRLEHPREGTHPLHQETFELNCSRTSIALDSTLVVVVEMSLSSWLVGWSVPKSPAWNDKR